MTVRFDHHALYPPLRSRSQHLLRYDADWTALLARSRGVARRSMSAALGWRLQHLAISRLHTPDEFATLTITPKASQDSIIIREILA